MSANSKFKSLLRNSFKRKNDTRTPYQTWEDEDSVLECDAASTNMSEPATVDKGLVECFYLGSFNMSGLPVRGRGCIDVPARAIWKQSQENDGKPKRKTSLSSKHEQDSYIINSLVSVSKPLRYVRLVAGSDDLEVYDSSTDELTGQFSFSKISFVGTHPKHSYLFVFIGVARDCQTPFCHAFKCGDKESADNTAHSLSDIFQQKIQAIQAKKTSIQVSACATVF